MSIYCVPQDLINRYDVSNIGDLLGDSSVRVSPANILSSPIVAAALDDAEGVINSFILIGQRYRSIDLQNLVGPDKNFLIRLVCDSAYIFLLQRRNQLSEDSALYKNTKDILDRLKNGDEIFITTGASNAGLPQGSFPSAVDVARINLAINSRGAERLFPVERIQQMP